jgi:hypothetical protein
MVGLLLTFSAGGMTSDNVGLTLRRKHVERRRMDAVTSSFEWIYLRSLPKAKSLIDAVGDWFLKSWG